MLKSVLWDVKERSVIGIGMGLSLETLDQNKMSALL